MATKYIWLKMTKEWGGFKVGSVQRFGESKGVERIEKGFGVKVDEPAASKRATAAAKATADKEAKAAKAAKAASDEKAAEEAKVDAGEKASEEAKAAAVAKSAKKAKSENADNRPGK